MNRLRRLAAAHAWNIDVSPVAAPGRNHRGGSLIIFQGKFATVVVNAPAISARRYYRAHFAAAH